MGFKLIDVANPDDPHEVSFDVGDELEVVNSSEQWWRVIATSKEGEKVYGIAPSNFLERIH